MQQLSDVPTGFDRSDLATMQVQWSAQHFDETGVQGFHARSLAAIRELPGVISATLTSQLPLSGDVDIYSVQVEDDTPVWCWSGSVSICREP